MAYDPGLAERLLTTVEQHFSHLAGLQPKKMFGGIGYLLNGNMCFGILNDQLMIRVGSEKAQEIIAPPRVLPMTLTGRTMKAWATITPEGMEDDDDLQKFCQYAVDFVQTLPKK